MNKKLAVLLLAGGLAIISVSHLVIENTTNVTEPSTEIESNTTDQLVQETKKSEVRYSVPIVMADNLDQDTDVQIAEENKNLRSYSRIEMN